MPSINEIPNNLPVRLTSFIGRETECSTVRHLAAENRLVTLTGAGGCGKTRLALQVAEDVPDGFSDGVWWVDQEQELFAVLSANQAATDDFMSVLAGTMPVPDFYDPANLERYMAGAGT